jgi:hypothetical protein
MRQNVYLINIKHKKYIMMKTTYLKSLLLIIAIGFSYLSAFSAQDTYTYSTGNGSGDANVWTFTTDNFNMVQRKNSSSNAIVSTYAELRVYISHSFEISPKIAGKTITSIVFTTTSSTYATALNNGTVLAGTTEATATALTGKSTVSGNNVTYDLSSVSNAEFFKVSLAAQTRFSSIVINYTESSSCTASTLSFANATVSKTMGDAAFTIAATSLNTTTAITYESNNTAVATVNAATGEVTLVAAGTAKIKATQAAGTHASVDYCAATAEYTLNVATNVPTITVTEVLPAFTANVGANDQKTLTVTGANLTADIALTITGADAAMFSVTNTLPAAGGTATITYSPTAPGAHTATLALNSTGATEVLLTLNGSGLTLLGNGSKTNPYKVADVKTLNNSLGAVNKYWVEGYIVGTPSGGNGTDLTSVALVAPFSNTALAIADMSGETDFTKMIGVQLPSGAIRDALSLVGTPANLNRRVKVFGNLQGYFSGTPGVTNTSDYEFSTTNSAPSATMQSLRKMGNQIVFETSAQQSVEIFNATGQRLMSTTSVDGVNAITVNTKGLVLVKIGKETAKVIM